MIEDEKKELEKPKKKKEEQSQLIQNLSRVTPEQLKHIQTTQGSRYLPVKSGKGALYGIVVLNDMTPLIPEKLINFGQVVENAVVTVADVLNTPDLVDSMVE